MLTYFVGKRRQEDQKKSHLADFLPFLIGMVEKILVIACLATLKECVHAKYVSPGVSSS